jgi:hypothetical protein
MPVPGGSDEMRAALDTYAERLTKQVFEGIAAKRSGRDVKLTALSELGITSGIMIANFLSPFDRMIRSLTRQLDGNNNMQQLM